MSGVADFLLQTSPVQFTQGLGEGLIRGIPETTVNLGSQRPSAPLSATDDAARASGRMAAMLFSLGLMPIGFMGKALGGIPGGISGMMQRNVAATYPMSTLTPEAFNRARQARLIENRLEQEFVHQARRPDPNPVAENPFRALTMNSLVRAIENNVLESPEESRLASEALAEKVQAQSGGFE